MKGEGRRGEERRGEERSRLKCSRNYCIEKESQCSGIRRAAHGEEAVRHDTSGHPPR